MSVSVPLIGDPRDQLLEALPFVHTRARDQCHSAIRRAFGAIAEQENVQILLNLATLNGPTLLAMVANVARIGSSDLVILWGREVDSGLAGLLHTSESVTGSDGDITRRVQLDRGSSEADGSSIGGSEANVSSLTGPSDSPSLAGGRDTGGDQEVAISDSATRGSVDEERIWPQGAEQRGTTHSNFGGNWDVGIGARRIRDRAAYRSFGSEASWMTPSSDIMRPPTRRADPFVNLRYENEKIRYWSSAATKLQRPWRLRRVDIMNPRSVAAALEAMRKSPVMSPKGYGHIDDCVLKALMRPRGSHQRAVGGFGIAK